MKKIDKNKIKTWFVTGASSGVGYQLCIELLNRGYNVVAVSRRVPDIMHKNVLCLSVDVTKPETIKEAVKLGIEKFDRIDVLSNNAGISASITCEEETLENMQKVMNTNFFGTFNMLNALLPHFRENGNGTIINNSSMSGLSFRALGSAYCSSKHAVEGLTKVCLHDFNKPIFAYKFINCIPFEDSAIEVIYQKSNRFRQIVKLILKFENLAKTNEYNVITKHIAESELL